ncbi:uncharacterized protein F5147DRAFT_295966 [Suillus discolor]|uniref:Uncharacterized protein n=1 Tax=Suillus discolor TaxID=1912936 RepID=A0A9P7JRD3_9AGAM|nr:uncharacterized protein F5147DRAFT_295966 [Suillus discolor]KAG2101810.1 hypothetical protein F5147DRAFT_295966 [Suillus discolor]
MSVISGVLIVSAVQVHPVKRNIGSSATCMSEYSWMDNSQGYSPCTTVAYVEAPCYENNYDQPILLNDTFYNLPNSSNANACYCSWSSYNLMMACTLCQGVSTSSVSEWPAWAAGCPTNQNWTQEYYPSGYVLTGDVSIPYWATTNPSTWTYETFNILDANATYQKNSSSITPGASSLSSGSGSSPSSSSSNSSSKSTDVGAIVGGTIGGAAAHSFLVIAAYLLYRRHVYRKGGYASAINQQGTTFIPSSHNRIPSDSSDLATSMSGPLAMYGQSVSPSQQYQTAYLSPHGSSLPVPRMDVSVYTTHTGNSQRSDAIPMV